MVSIYLPLLEPDANKRIVRLISKHDFSKRFNYFLIFMVFVLFPFFTTFQLFLSVFHSSCKHSLRCRLTILMCRLFFRSFLWDGWRFYQSIFNRMLINSLTYGSTASLLIPCRACCRQNLNFNESRVCIHNLPISFFNQL